MRMILDAVRRAWEYRMRAMKRVLWLTEIFMKIQMQSSIYS
jgi:hypothetical protein